MGDYEPISGVNKEIITNFEFVCPEFKDTTLNRNNVYLSFIKDQLVAIELVLQTSDKLELFEWGREYFGIIEEEILQKRYK